MSAADGSRPPADERFFAPRPQRTPSPGSGAAAAAAASSRSPRGGGGAASPQPMMTDGGALCASATLPPAMGLASCPFYQSADFPAEAARQTLAQRGLVSQGLQAHAGPLTLHTFQLNDAYCVSFCQYFFMLRKLDTGEALHVQLLDSGAVGALPTSAGADGDEMMDATGPPTPQSILRSGTPTPRMPAAPGAYSVGRQGYVITKSKVAATILRDQLNASAATMACLLETEVPGRRESESATKILHLLKECFVEISTYKYEVGLPSHKWTTVAGLDARFLLQVASECQQIMKDEPTLLRLDPPVYVIGDLHGNYKDFAYFAKAFGLWSSAEFVPARFLFLGDYVDRGLHSIETLAFVLALKTRFPDKIFLLRGNHECAEINGDEDLYLSGSFKTQLKLTYGVRDGEELWRAFNRCFEVMPLAAVIDRKVFCVHAGIPRYIARNPSCDILNTIESVPRPPNITDDLVFDLLWADPATLAEERFIGMDGFPPGFGRNTRGPATCVFGKEAVRLFMEKSGCSHLIRAHQSPRLGVDISKNAAILTVFSSSHYCGGYNRAASVLVHDHRLDIILSNPDATGPEIISSTSDYTS